MKRTFLILHGWQGNADNHWQTLLAHELQDRRQHVVYPNFPDVDHPKRDAWLTVLRNEWNQLSDAHTVTVITHSLAGALWLHFLAEQRTAAPERTFFVAPTPNDCGESALASFFPLPDVSKKRLGMTLLIYSDTDPFIARTTFEKFQRQYSLESHFIPRAGHINADAGYGPWPWLLQQCLPV